MKTFQLKCTNSRKFGRTVLVNGTIYGVSTKTGKVMKGGKVAAIPEADARKLLQGAYTYGDDENKRLDPLPDGAPEPEKEEPDVDPTTKLATDSSALPESVKEPEGDEAPEGEPKSVEDPEEDSEGDEEWPEPTTDLPIETLREMAEHFEVTYNTRTSAETLVERLTEAMYEDDGEDEE